MKSTSVRKIARFVGAVASALLIVCTGCSTGGGTAGETVKAPSVSMSKQSRDVETESDPILGASANVMRDLAAAQPESVLSSSRDVDLNGGGGEAAGPALTYQSLGEMLQKIGLTPEDDKDCYVMKVKATTEDQVAWTFPIAVSLSPDSTLVWITCPLSQIDKNGSPGAQVLFDLLSANYHLGSTFFVLDPKHFLVLQQPLANTGISPQFLGSNLKMFFGNLKASEPVFKSVVGVAGSDDGGNKSPFQ